MGDPKPRGLQGSQILAQGRRAQSTEGSNLSGKTSGAAALTDELIRRDSGDTPCLVRTCAASESPSLISSEWSAAPPDSCYGKISRTAHAKQNESVPAVQCCEGLPEHAARSTAKRLKGRPASATNSVLSLDMEDFRCNATRPPKPTELASGSALASASNAIIEASPGEAQSLPSL